MASWTFFFFQGSESMHSLKNMHIRAGVPPNIIAELEERQVYEEKRGYLHPHKYRIMQLIIGGFVCGTNRVGYFWWQLNSPTRVWLGTMCAQV